MTSVEEQQAHLLTRMLVGVPPPARAVELYVRAVQALPPCTAEEQAHLGFLLAHPWCARFLDGGLGWRRPDHALRRRVLVMLAILEVQPGLSQMFLPPSPSWTEWWTVTLAGMRAVACALLGALLLKVLPHG